MKKKLLLFFTVFSFAACLFAKDERPNIITILVDDMGYSDWGCFGSEIQTPNVDKLATEGVRLTEFHNSAKCHVSRAELHTGRWNSDAFGNPIENVSAGPFTKDSVMIGEVLRSGGYSTYFVGKHHCQTNPYKAGYDQFYGFMGGNRLGYLLPNSPDKSPRGVEPLNELYVNDKFYMTIGDLAKKHNYDPKFFLTDHFTDKAIEFLDDAKKKDKPFYMFVGYTAPHFRIQAKDSDRKKYEGLYDKGYTAVRNARYEKQLKLGLFTKETHRLVPYSEHQEWDGYSPKKKAIEARRMEVYAGLVDNIDQNIGRLVSYLKENNLYDNTIIMIMSDNGASHEEQNQKDKPDYSEARDVNTIGHRDYFDFQGPMWAMVSDTPFRGMKGSAYEGGMTTSFIMHWKNGEKFGMKKGMISAYPAAFVDIMPTLMEVSKTSVPEKNLNGEKPAQLVGESFAFLLNGKDREMRTQKIYKSWGKAFFSDGYKLVIMGGKNGSKQTAELYDMRKDKTEMDNLAKKMPERTAEMLKDFNAWAEAQNKKYADSQTKQKKGKKAKQ